MTTMPMMTHVSRHPTTLMMVCSVNGASNGPSPPPMTAMPNAFPRFRTNHLGRMACVSASPMPRLPMAANTP